MVFYITGGAGYLGSNIIRALLQEGHTVCTLVLPKDPAAAQLPEGTLIMEGNLLNQEDVDRFFSAAAKENATIIHCAAMVSIAWNVVDKVRQVNVEGTRSIVNGCLQYNLRLIHVASVHAIPEKPQPWSLNWTLAKPSTPSLGTLLLPSYAATASRQSSHHGFMTS